MSEINVHPIELVRRLDLPEGYTLEGDIPSRCQVSRVFGQDHRLSILKQPTDCGDLEPILNEQIILSKLRHQNIQRIKTSDTMNLHTIFYYTPGVTLKDFAQGVYPEQVPMNYFLRVAETLAWLHERGIAHTNIGFDGSHNGVTNLMIDTAAYPHIVGFCNAQRGGDYAEDVKQLATAMLYGINYELCEEQGRKLRLRKFMPARRGVKQLLACMLDTPECRPEMGEVIVALTDLLGK